ncbi:MAG: glycosyltransferase [Phycisphaerae bacterium]|nr:glycosyltransferase [Phycisphaerae bacterium]
MHIVHLLSNPNVGGAETFALNVTRSWQRAGHCVRVVNLWEDIAGIRQIFESAGVEYMSIPCGHRRINFRRLGRVFRFFRENPPDIALVYGLRLQLMMRLFRGRLPRQTRVLTMLRGADPWRKIWHILMDRWTVRRFDCHVACSQAVQDIFLRREHYPPNRTLCIPNGIDLVRFARKQTKPISRQELGIPDNAVVCTTVANFRSIKGHSFLIDSMIANAQAMLDQPIWFLWLGKDQGELAGYSQRLSEAGLAHRVVIPGQVLDVRPYLAASNLFILPSESEGMPRALMEAMAMGLPAVATNVDGTGEVLRNGIDGYLVEYGDVEAMAGRILELADEPDRCKAMGESAIQRIRENFDIDSIAEEYLKLFGSLLEESRSGVNNCV